MVKATQTREGTVLDELLPRVLRKRPNIKWKEDRGKEPQGLRPQDRFPWFWKDGEFTGERVNDVHLTNAEKRVARERARSSS